jgi:hypothetical protein
MWWKLFAVVLVVVLIAGALELGGALRPPERVSQRHLPVPPRQFEAEREWVERMNAICERERQQAKALRKALRGVTTPRDFELLFETALRMGEANLRVFSRLDPPLTLRRETRELRRLFRAEQDAAEAMLEAFRDGSREAFLRRLRAFLSADERSTRLLVRLGASDCGVKPLRSYPETRTLPA